MRPSIPTISPPPTIYTTLAGYDIAERDGERRESGRRACLRIGTACDTVRSGTCMRYGAGPDGVRAYGSGRRACYGSGRRATRCGPGRRAKVGTAFERRCGYDRRVRTVRFGTMCERDGAARASTHENYDVPGSRSWRRSSVAQGARGAPSKVMINGLFGSASCPPS